MDKYQNFGDIFGDTELPTENKKDQYTSTDQIFGEQPAPSTDEALATYAYGDPDMSIGEESLLAVGLASIIWILNPGLIIKPFMFPDKELKLAFISVRFLISKKLTRELFSLTKGVL